MNDREHMLAEIEAKLSQPIPIDIAAALRATIPALPLPETARELVGLIRRGEMEPLAALLARYRNAKGDRDAFFLILAALGRKLDGLFWKRMRARADAGLAGDWANESWAVVIHCFCDALLTCKPAGAKLDDALVNRTQNNILRWSRSDERLLRARKHFRRRAKPVVEQAHAPGDSRDVHEGVFEFKRTGTPPPAPRADEIEIAEAKAALEKYVTAGILAPADRDLLVAHHACGDGVREVARAQGMKVATLKSRLQRARAAIRDHEEKEKKRRKEKDGSGLPD
ncbi:MAG TPA: hypothetical protein VMV18_00685 [bacterium]|nr:hypothetical protein [bacterium]